jgi:glycosyltransferase involved in cell wall biosynthesis
MCHQDAAMLDNVTFEDWMAYDHLPERIARADILLGVFGNTPKALRVIPNKVFQALACGKPLITGAAPAYPDELRAEPRSGITWVPMNDPAALATAVAGVAAHPDQLAEEGLRARTTYERFFAPAEITEQLRAALLVLYAAR